MHLQVRKGQKHTAEYKADRPLCGTWAEIDGAPHFFYWLTAVSSKHLCVHTSPVSQALVYYAKWII